jgi:acetyl esterase/lipase
MFSGALVLAVTVISLWPHGAPGGQAKRLPELDTTKPGDPLVAGRAVVRLGPVSEPTLTVYPAPSTGAPSPAVLVFPGGGYRILALDLEGKEVCSWLNSVGYTAVLVKYRVGPPGGAEQYAEPLADAQQAMALVREHAAEWKIDPRHIGSLGFSAGGHLAALLNTTQARAHFTVLVYPAYLTDVGAPGSADVASQSTPTFIVQTEDDRSFIDGTLAYYKTLKAAGVPVEIHLFSKGGHGYGLRPTGEGVAQWPVLVESWFKHVLAGNE